LGASSNNLDYDLPEMCPFFHSRKASASLAHWKYAVHHRADLMRRDGVIHGFEMSP
jgi:hypothetical protein